MASRTRAFTAVATDAPARDGVGATAIAITVRLIRRRFAGPVSIGGTTYGAAGQMYYHIHTSTRHYSMAGGERQ